jgi:hypothetical protein
VRLVRFHGAEMMGIDAATIATFNLDAGARRMALPIAKSPRILGGSQPALIERPVGAKKTCIAIGVDATCPQPTVAGSVTFLNKVPESLFCRSEA